MADTPGDMMDAGPSRPPAGAASDLDALASEALANARLQGIASIVAALPTAAILVKGSAAVVAINAAARALCAESHVFVDSHGRLRAHDPQLEAHIIATVVGAQDNPGEPQRLRLSRPEADGEIFASIAHVGGQWGTASMPGAEKFAGGALDAVIVHLSREAGARGRVIDGIKGQYGLADIEARAVYAIYRGDTQAAFARSEEIHVALVDAIWERAMARLGVNRRRDVVRRVAMFTELSGDN
ncbi:hypothetical protein L1787_12485 [Acuticoccus sp. M5D2P5]|uniref:hypothetical protein n=1 Tax=Acuticoccus kalidii TaxID=2910977 RepID=UPI001F3B5C3A|nr:hypothetical protein [Acuticoccus kalidii]MCF3934225.1 hypothetical protein [Acuticoccus kalidii]